MHIFTTIAVRLTILAAFFVPYLNHMVTCFQDEKYLLLIGGAIIFPIGWIHGLGVFFGWWV